MKLLSVIRNWRKSHILKGEYLSSKREPFFDLASKYLPKGDELVVDIGAGDGGFARFLKAQSKCPNLFLLDGNKETVENLSKNHGNAILYNASGPLPFPDASIYFMHCSHILEHLTPGGLHGFLREIDRVLASGGILAISAPLLWPGFYEDLSHIKPYNPQAFIDYFCSGGNNLTFSPISKDYQVEKLVYRYRAGSFDEGWDSKFFFASLFLKIIKTLAEKTGFYKTIKNGFTLILRKK
ncbi:MAG: class I SAM-dependent methyltransferase [Candidatus Portnoybacteria bacterium]|nr:class I SAM-dependent methyltransferase [Candidatus Portnoybacteria bacterium]